jgi:hypothetical protein
MIDELVDSTPMLGDWPALRARIRADGYVFCRGLLDPARVGDAERLARANVPPGPVEPLAAVSHPGYRSVLTSPEFNRLAYEPGLRTLMTNILGPNGFVYPIKVLRIVHPEAVAGVHRGRYVHQDISVIGVQDMFTAWMPLGDVPAELGGLAVLPGSQGRELAAPRPWDQRERGWASADYQAGDVVVFHCCTAHASRPNQSPSVRISAECRWQLADDPVPRRLIEGPAGRGHRELFSRLFQGTDWWRPVPANLQLVDRDDTVDVSSIAPSRFVDLPIGWNRGGVVHIQRRSP